MSQNLDQLQRNRNKKHWFREILTLTFAYTVFTLSAVGNTSPLGTIMVFHTQNNTRRMRAEISPQ
jgi:hypothetical protein